jgi:aminopeptidase N
LALPAETYIAEFTAVVDPDAIHNACRFVRRTLAAELRNVWQHVFTANQDRGEYSIDAVAMARRSLKNTALGYLMELDDADIRRICAEQFHTGNNMTDVVTALVFLNNSGGAEGDAALAAFYNQWQDDNLVLDKWFAIQSTSRRPDTLQRVVTLTQHPAFNIKNPNRMRAVIGAFAHGNHVRFHDHSGAGYALLGDYVIALNALNPLVAARLVSAFTAWRRYDRGRQGLMKKQLERLRDHDNLSKDVFEIVSKSLA